MYVLVSFDLETLPSADSTHFIENAPVVAPLIEQPDGSQVEAAVGPANSTFRKATYSGLATGANKAAAAAKSKALQAKHGVRGLLARKDLENDLVEYVYARCMSVKAVYSGYSEVQRVEMEFRFKGDFEVV